MANPADVALKKIEKVLSRDPMLRDVLSQTLPRSRRSGAFSPAVDVLEQPDKYTVLLDLPGVVKDGVTVRLEGTKLVVEGTRPLGHPSGTRVRAGERSSGAFRREFLLPHLVRGERVTARLADGVLTVEIPRVESQQVVDIDVG
jgi:HSP20 family protein